MWEFEGFKILEQLLIPAISGGIGGLALVVMASLNDTGVLVLKKILKIYIKFIFLGATAGVAAVNLLNPNGDISQVMVLGLIAGLSAFTYLKRTALVDNFHEDVVFNSIKEEALENAESAGFVDLTEEDWDLFLEEDEETDEGEDDEDQELVDRYIDIKMSEWIYENPNSSEEELDAYLDSVIENVIENPDLVKILKDIDNGF